MKLHIHRDRNYQLVGCHYYFECKCGARKVRRAYSNQMGPIAPGWPPLRDKHGTSVIDSGWRVQQT